MTTSPRSLIVKTLGITEYKSTWQAMRDFTDNRTAETPDELWLTEHHPVFTQGQAGKPEHLLRTSDIPVVKTDRGGQITYHGPGQLIVYPLLNLKRLKIGVRDLVTGIENSVVNLMKHYGINAAAKPDAPGVYVANRKVASLGLRIRKGFSFHGVAINVSADLTPFQQINPCGYSGLEMVNLCDLIAENEGSENEGREHREKGMDGATRKAITVSDVQTQYLECLKQELGLN